MGPSKRRARAAEYRPKENRNGDFTLIPPPSQSYLVVTGEFERTLM